VLASALYNGLVDTAMQSKKGVRCLVLIAWVRVAAGDSIRSCGVAEANYPGCAAVFVLRVEDRANPPIRRASRSVADEPGPTRAGGGAYDFQPLAWLQNRKQRGCGRRNYCFAQIVAINIVK